MCPFADDLVHDFLLVELALEIVIGRAGVSGCVLRVFDEFLGHVLNHGNEVFSTYLDTEIDEPVQMLVVPERKIAFENHSVVTGQTCYNPLGEFLDKSHGALLRSVVVVTHKTGPIAERYSLQNATPLFACGHRPP